SEIGDQDAHDLPLLAGPPRPSRERGAAHAAQPESIRILLAACRADLHASNATAQARKHRPRYPSLSAAASPWSSSGQAPVAERHERGRKGRSRSCLVDANGDWWRIMATGFDQIAPRRSPVRARLAPPTKTLETGPFCWQRRRRGRRGYPGSASRSRQEPNPQHAHQRIERGSNRCTGEASERGTISRAFGVALRTRERGPRD